MFLELLLVIVYVIQDNIVHAASGVTAFDFGLCSVKGILLKPDQKL